ncbi:MAG: hypothetical protein IIW08_10820 [Clostridia bacterium]|nr:hypothetical protein [Clostridia bacterium]
MAADVNDKTSVGQLNVPQVSFCIPAAEKRIRRAYDGSENKNCRQKTYDCQFGRKYPFVSFQNHCGLGRRIKRNDIGRRRGIKFKPRLDGYVSSMKLA